MYKYACILLTLLCVVSSCQTIEELSIDYMLPAEVSFPAELRKVAVINNITPAPPTAAEQNSPDFTQISSTTVTWEPAVDMKVATESLAQSIAQENYFDEVVICDSVLRASDILPRENTLSRNEVAELTRQLDVDLLISLEEVRIVAKRSLQFVSMWNTFWGTVDVKVYPVAKIYLPNRNGPMATISAKDSIFWEEYGTETYIRSKLIKYDELVQEASEFAGSLPVHYLVPYWTSDMRYYYSGGSVNMRDAAYCARENDWEKAYTLWEKAYQSTKNKKKKLYLAHNIALSYEMRDSLPEAAEWANKAQNLAIEIEKVDLENSPQISFDSHPLSVRTTLYLREIEKRKELSMKLNAQMKRFNDEF